VLSANGMVPSGRLEKTVLLGELALDGRVRPVRRVLPAVIAANYGGFYGHDTQDVMQELNVRDAQQQSFLANAGYVWTRSTSLA
jgi:predicted ATPase with chaperone activity